MKKLIKRIFSKHQNGPSKNQRILLSVMVIAVVAAGFLAYYFQTSKAYIQRDKYQVVFLNNDQFYFGKLQILNDNSYRLTDVYYIQQTQADNKDGQGGANQEAANTPRLVKLGNELHGPDDAMFFNSSQVLFWENLKSDSKVTKAIAEYQKK